MDSFKYGKLKETKAERVHIYSYICRETARPRDREAPLTSLRCPPGYRLLSRSQHDLRRVKCHTLLVFQIIIFFGNLDKVHCTFIYFLWHGKVSNENRRKQHSRLRNCASHFVRNVSKTTSIQKSGEFSSVYATTPCLDLYHYYLYFTFMYVKVCPNKESRYFSLCLVISNTILQRHNT